MKYMEDTDESTVDFFTSFQKRLPPSIQPAEGEAVVETEGEVLLVINPINEALVESSVQEGKNVE